MIDWITRNEGSIIIISFFFGVLVGAAIFATVFFTDSYNSKNKEYEIYVIEIKG